MAQYPDIAQNCTHFLAGQNHRKLEAPGLAGLSSEAFLIYEALAKLMAQGG